MKPRVPRIKTSKISEYALRGIFNFPLVVLNALIGSISLIIYIQSTFDKPSDSGAFYLVNIALAAGFGLPLLFAFSLWGKRIRNPIIVFFLQMAGAALVMLLYGLLPDTSQAYSLVTVYRLVILTLCATLFCTFVLFVHVREDNGFWQFNRACLEAAFSSSIYSALLFTGSCLALYSLRYLFQIHIEEKTFAQIFVFSFGTINVWYFLALLPIRPEALETEGKYPKNLKFITQYALIPLISLYGLILYAYGLKIVFEWKLPKGSIALLVSAFSAMGILAIFLIYPLRKQESKRWVSFFKNVFYIALLPLLALLLVAIGKRVEEYGFTENRYLLLALAIWLVGIAIYFIRKQDGRLIYIPMTLLVVILLCAFTPYYNAFSVSKKSQVAQLDQLLHSSGVLVSDTIGDKRIGRKTIENVEQILVYLDERHALGEVLHYFGKRGEAIAKSQSPFDKDKVHALLALFKRKSETRIEKNFYASSTEISLKGFQYLIPMSRSDRKAAGSARSEGYGSSLLVRFQGHSVHISLKDRLLQLNSAFFQAENPVDSLVVPFSDSLYSGELRIQKLSLDAFSQDSVSIRSLSGYLLLKKRDSIP